MNCAQGLPTALLTGAVTGDGPFRGGLKPLNPGRGQGQYTDLISAAILAGIAAGWSAVRAVWEAQVPGPSRAS